MVGADGVKNEQVMMLCICAYTITSIDGEPIMPPNTYNELRALVGRLGDEGIEAVEQAYIEAGWGVSVSVDDKDAIKNS